MGRVRERFRVLVEKRPYSLAFLIFILATVPAIWAIGGIGSDPIRKVSVLGSTIVLNVMLFIISLYLFDRNITKYHVKEIISKKFFLLIL